MKLAAAEVKIFWHKLHDFIIYHLCRIKYTNLSFRKHWKKWEFLQNLFRAQFSISFVIIFPFESVDVFYWFISITSAAKLLKIKISKNPRWRPRCPLLFEPQRSKMKKFATTANMAYVYWPSKKIRCFSSAPFSKRRRAVLTIYCFYCFYYFIFIGILWVPSHNYFYRRSRYAQYLHVITARDTFLRSLRLLLYCWIAYLAYKMSHIQARRLTWACVT